MTSGATRRYGIGVLVLAFGLGVTGVGIATVAAEPGWVRALLVAVLVAAFADVPVYFALRHGLVERPDRFARCWMATEIFKVVHFAGTGTVLVLGRFVATKPFLLGLVAAFAAFTTHQVIRLVRESDVRHPPGARAGVVRRAAGESRG